MSFASELKANDKKGLLQSDDTFVTYPTGILPLDYANGFWMTTQDEAGNIIYEPVIGIMGGTFITIIGATGTGKTTLADQIAYAIINPFEDGIMYHEDCEQTALKPRIIRITGADPDDERVNLKKKDIYIEDVLEMMDTICAAKEAGGDRFKYTVENRTYNRKSFKVYIPTVFIIDSLPAFNSKAFNTADLGTNMDGARGARDVSRFYENSLGKMQKYNITVIVVNHIRVKVEANPYAAAPPGLMMLKPSENLVRGYVSQYLAQNVFRCNMVKSGMYTLDDVGFEGFKASIQIAKTKTAFVGASVDVAFNKDLGYDPVFSLFEFANSIKFIEGKNPYLHFVTLESMKFSRKDFRRKFLDEKPFRDAVLGLLKPHLEQLLGTKEITTNDQVRYGDLMRRNEMDTKRSDELAEAELIRESKTKKKK